MNDDQYRQRDCSWQKSVIVVLKLICRIWTHNHRRKKKKKVQQKLCVLGGYRGMPKAEYVPNFVCTYMYLWTLQNFLKNHYHPDHHDHHKAYYDHHCNHRHPHHDHHHDDDHGS